MKRLAKRVSILLVAQLGLLRWSGSVEGACMRRSPYVHRSRGGYDCDQGNGNGDLTLPDIMAMLPDYGKVPYLNESYPSIDFDLRDPNAAICGATHDIPPPNPDPNPDPVPDPDPTCADAEGLCRDYYDIVFAVDESSYSGEDNWMNVVKPFVKSVATTLPMGADKVHMALVLFADDTRTIVTFEDAASKDSAAFGSALDTIADVAKFNNSLYADALMFAAEELLFEGGSRPDAAKVTLLFTYAYDNGLSKEIIPAVIEKYEELCIKLLTFSMLESPDVLALTGCTGNSSACPSVIKTDWFNIMEAPELIKSKICPTSSDSRHAH